jgi:hypothetical protein
MPDSKKIEYIQKRIDSVADTVANIDKEVALHKVALEAHTKHDEELDEELHVELRRMNDIMQSNTDSLKEHMSNNILLKDMVSSINKRLDPIELEFIQKNAVKSWMMTHLKILAKFSTAIAALAGAWVYVKPFIEHLFK